MHFLVLLVALTTSFNPQVRHCNIHNNCTSSSNSILIAIDGTGSRKSLEESTQTIYKSPIGVNKNGFFIWHSHCANFWEDYKGTAYFFHGPDCSEMVCAARQLDRIVKNAKTSVCQFIRDYVVNELDQTPVDIETINDGINIDLIGHSRGGYGAMHLSRILQKEGCDIFGKMVKPIKVRWMGLYDPVARDIDIDDEFDSQQISNSVMNIAVAERDPRLRSRALFGYAVHGFDSNIYPKNRYIRRFYASHSAIGGSPGEGDCKVDPSIWDIPAIICRDWTLQKDKTGAEQSDIWMRKHAINVGVPIPETNGYYYSNFQRF